MAVVPRPPMTRPPATTVHVRLDSRRTNRRSTRAAVTACASRLGRVKTDLAGHNRGGDDKRSRQAEGGRYWGRRKKGKAPKAFANIPGGCRQFGMLRGGPSAQGEDRRIKSHAIGAHHGPVYA